MRSPDGPTAERCVDILRELGKRRVFLQGQLTAVQLELEAAIVAADDAFVPRRAIAREAGVVRQTVYNVLARQMPKKGGEA